MDIDARKQKILEILNKNGKVKVGELAAMFDISVVSVRIDLADLESKGLLSRIHGGAISSYKPYYNMNLTQRLSTNQEQKTRIAEKVAGMIEENDIVILNAGTTNLLILRNIPVRMNLSIVTNSIAIALEAAANPNFNVVLLTGYVNPKYQFTYGDEANNQLERYHADKLILSVDGINTDGVISTYYNTEAELDRRMMSHANKNIVAADYTKIGRTAFAEIAALTGEDMIVTNREVPEEDLSAIRKCVGEVVLT
ncbi:MAG: DeoR/GlpR family DNA-binding transcription regulator [Oscillospiraceae bacterium]|jgi:DeoR/GlpR family transcriptional regulator of sugar metabolism|nr:DeoR/GlpR family DNA-binding transcription regulator [Oscillospiraceae bacterium]